MTSANSNPRKPRWAPRVPRELIRRLYESDARGILDEDLVDQVGYALYARSVSMVQATEASHGKVLCPECGLPIQHDRQDDTEISCVRCGWHMKWRVYRRTYRKKKLLGQAALDFLNEFVRRFPQCRSYSDKLIAIDRLIHTFHHQLRKWPTAPIAKNLIEGNVQEVVELLDRLAYGERGTPETLRTKELYRATLARSWVGGCRRPKDWRAPADPEDTHSSRR